MTPTEIYKDYIEYLKSDYIKKYVYKNAFVDFLFWYGTYYVMFPKDDATNNWQIEKVPFKDEFTRKKKGVHAFIFAIPITLLNLHTKGYLYWISLKPEGKVLEK